MEGVITTIITTFGSVLVAGITVGLPLLSSSKKQRKSDTEKIISRVNEIDRKLTLNNGLTISNGRGLIESIYTKYRDKKQMPRTSWKVVCDIYRGYKKLPTGDGYPPDGYVDDMMVEMEGWEKY